MCVLVVRVVAWLLLVWLAVAVIIRYGLLWNK